MPDPRRLEDLFNTGHLKALIDRGLITCRTHPTEPLVVYDYTSKASATATWTAETLQCRGLIADLEGNVVARPFPKFFSLSDHERYAELDPVPVDVPFEVSEKMDGSLGILYPTKQGPAISTRGTFNSSQALWATEHLRANFDQVTVPSGVTLLFEIIYPDNRIVVDYAGFSGIVLLAVLDNATGADLALPSYWPGPVVDRHDVDSLDLVRSLTARDEANREGFVVRFAASADQPSLRVKLKFGEYLRLHQLLTGVSTRTIWERLSTGGELHDMVERVPSDFAVWVQSIAAELRHHYSVIENQCRKAFSDARVDSGHRRETADYFAECGANTAVLFKMLDGRSYDEIIWRALRPSDPHSFQT